MDVRHGLNTSYSGKWENGRNWKWEACRVRVSSRYQAAVYFTMTIPGLVSWDGSIYLIVPSDPRSGRSDCKYWPSQAKLEPGTGSKSVILINNCGALEIKELPDQMLLARCYTRWYLLSGQSGGMGYWLWIQLTLLCAWCHLGINIYAPHRNIAALCLSIFQVRDPPLSDNNLLLCTLFIILVSTSFFDFGYFDSRESFI